MTGGRVLLDTGPLVAILHRDDRAHQRCIEVFKTFQGVLLSTEPVLTEALYLLRGVPGGQRACLEFFIRGAAVLVPATRKNLQRCQFLMMRYANVPMDFADATVVALGEEAGVREVFTLDRRGFETYRMEKRQTFRLWPASGSM